MLLAVRIEERKASFHVVLLFVNFRRWEADDRVQMETLILEDGRKPVRISLIFSPQ